MSSSVLFPQPHPSLAFQSAFLHPPCLSHLRSTFSSRCSSSYSVSSLSFSFALFPSHRHPHLHLHLPLASRSVVRFRFPLTIYMQGKLTTLRHRLDAIMCSVKIISAMRLLAAARIHRAAQSAVAYRPFTSSVTQTLVKVLTALEQSGKDPSKIAWDTARDAPQLPGHEGIGGDFILHMMQQNAYKAIRSSWAGHHDFNYKVTGKRAKNSNNPLHMHLQEKQRSFQSLEELEQLEAPHTLPPHSPHSQAPHTHSKVTQHAHTSHSQSHTQSLSSRYLFSSSPPPTTPTPSSSSKLYVDQTNYLQLHHKTLLVVIAGDQGMCGPYNKAVCKKAELRLLQLRRHDAKVSLLIVGRKAVSYFKYRYPNIETFSTMPLGKPKYAVNTCERIAEDIMLHFLAGNLDRVEVVYSNFKSLLKSTPSIRTLLPLSLSGLEHTDDEIHDIVLSPTKTNPVAFKTVTRQGEPDSHATQKSNQYTSMLDSAQFDQPPLHLLMSILPMYIESQLLRIIHESIAGEMASRMAAMERAMENAQQLEKNIRVLMNKERQEKITRELAEVTSGYNQGNPQ